MPLGKGVGAAAVQAAEMTTAAVAQAAFGRHTHADYVWHPHQSPAADSKLYKQRVQDARNRQQVQEHAPLLPIL